MDLRRVLYSNIVLSGGSTLFKGNVRYLAVNNIMVFLCKIFMYMVISKIFYPFFQALEIVF